jgi:hypothetical protein
MSAHAREPLAWPVLAPSERLAQIRLRVAVDEQHAPAGLGEHRAEVGRRRRLGDAALVVGQYDHERGARAVRAVLTDRFTALYLYIYTSVYLAVFTYTVMY